ncbi:MAG TPA: hypothetical protein DD435_06520 [Cyanobacteria bacterium UBA8530]|nr:hypothetical protein [Cyanobacteria bacterium UBA8530]
MKKKNLASLIAFSMAAIALSGCGVGLAGANLKLSTASDQYNADATQTITKSFKEIHKAIFALIDNNKDKQIDEYEAGQYIRLTDMAKMDKDHNGKISYTVFMTYATDNGFFGGTDNANKYLKRMRSDLQYAFKTLDRDKSWLLEAKELTNTQVKKLGLGFAYDNLHITLKMPSFAPEDIAAADKTGDAKLSQAEFEDLYINKVKSLINPAGNSPEPAPAPSIDPIPSPVPSAPVL